MKMFNFMEMYKDMEDFYDIKKDVEYKMKENGKLEEDKRLSLEDFITNTFSKTVVYSYRGEVVPFTIVEGKEDKYVIFTANLPLTELYDRFEANLRRINYNLNNLSPVNNLLFEDDEYNTKELFIMNGAYYQ